MERSRGALSSLCLFCVEILVRFREQFLDALAIAVVAGDADTRGEARRFIVVGHDFADAIGDAARFVFLGFRENQGEFVAAVSRGSVNCAAMNPENIGEAADGTAADKMAVTIVNRFQTIEVEKQHGEGPASAIGALRLVFKNIEQAAVVGKAGERIADGQMVDLFEEPRVSKKRATQRDNVAQDHESLGENKGTI